MGLVDKVLETFKAWTIYEIENLPEQSNQIRQTYRSTISSAIDAIANEARVLEEEAGNITAESRARQKEAKDTRAVAKSEKTKAQKNHYEMVKRHNAKLVSLSQDFDCIFRAQKIQKEHYHGGKYNGVNCIKIMAKAKALFEDFSLAIKMKKVPTIDDAVVETKCTQFAKLLGLLDAIWSNVRGMDAGLLPTEVQLEYLEKALTEGKLLWLAMGIKTLQPKWHMTFDGHLLHQAKTYGGLADKADDTIELQHQILMKLRDRHRSITSYPRRETCIRRELRRRKSTEIQGHLDECEASIKEKSTGKRAIAAAARQQEQREAKRVKREGFVNGE